MSTISYIDNNNNRGRWTQVCTKCSSYTRSRSFEEGINNLTFKAKDTSGNEAFFEVSFRIDSKDPKIKGTEPSEDFASGEFEIEFEEDNPESLMLFYGNGEVGMREYPVGLNSCIEDGSTLCTANVNLADYDGQGIEYYFELTDMAGTMVSSKIVSLNVDYSDPIINSLDFEVDGKSVMFVLDINEPYFKEAVYVDISEDNPREKRMCSKLSGGVCGKKINFKDGNHEVVITVRDLAGNYVNQSVEFFTDSKEPRIGRLEPRGGFASGFFSAEIREDNLKEVELFHGNEGSGISSHMLDIASECITDRGKRICTTFADLSMCDGEEIEYWFEARDIIGQEDISRPVALSVDTTFPAINLVNYTVEDGKAEIILNVTEINFDKAYYKNNADRNPRETVLCSKIDDNGMCSKRNIRLNEGVNRIDIQVVDKAGNSVGRSIEIVL